jgi:hypothetical protein
MSVAPFVSVADGSRLVASDAKTTKRPSAEICGVRLSPLASTAPSAAEIWLMRSG